MIFVTVGTHEQPFNRLLEEVDRLKKNGAITDEIVVQRGYSKFTPEAEDCVAKDIFSYKEMMDLYRDADVIITHGGPATFMQALMMDKHPIVVPRLKTYGEHVNDHQLIFCQQVMEYYPITVVTDMEDLANAIQSIKSLTSSIQSRNEEFTDAFIREVNQLFKEE